MTRAAASRTEIRITGFGGQGVVLAAHIIGRACAINASQHATMIQSFGPEARGSSCSATLVVSDEEVLYPYIRRADIFVVMSSEGYEKFRGSVKDGGTLIYEQDLVKPAIQVGQRAFGVPSTRIAESIGRTLVQNIVMVGFFTAVTGIVPKGTEELNLKAFNAGVAHFEQTLQAATPSEVTV